MSKIKLTIFIIICLMTKISKAQKVSVIWNNLDVFNFELLGGPNSIEMNGSYYCMSYKKGLIGNFPYYLVKLDGNLSLEKSIKFPYKYNGNPLELVSIRKDDSKIIVLFKYYETSGDNRYVLLKTIFDKNLSNPITFEKVEDIPTMGNTKPQHVLNLFNYNKNGDIMLMKVPREAYSFNNYSSFKSYTFSSYNSDLSKREWSSTMDLGELGENFEIYDGKFSINKEYVFVMKAKMKAFKKVDRSMFICKYTKEKGVEIKELNLDGSSNGLNLFIDSTSNMFYVYGYLNVMSSKEDVVFIKKFDVNTLEEINSSSIELGIKGENGFRSKNIFGPQYEIRDLQFRWVGKDNESGNLTLIAEIYKDYEEKYEKKPDGTSELKKINGISATILCLKLNSKGDFIKKMVLPREQKIKDYSSPYSSFISANVDGKFHFLFYDDKKNIGLTKYNGNTDIKVINDDNDNELYKITIDKDNNLVKELVIKEYTGNTSKLNKKQNFETKTATYLSPGKFLVIDKTNIGILTIE